DASRFELYLWILGDLQDFSLHCLLHFRPILRLFWIEYTNGGCRERQCNRRMRYIVRVNGCAASHLCGFYQMIMAERSKQAVCAEVEAEMSASGNPTGRICSTRRTRCQDDEHEKYCPTFHIHVF